MLHISIIPQFKNEKKIHINRNFINHAQINTCRNKRKKFFKSVFSFEKYFGGLIVS